MPSQILLYGHGSRDPQWRTEFDAMAQAIRAAVADACHVSTAFLQFIPPTLRDAVAEAVDQGITHIHIVPVFLFPGQHVRNDIPAAVAELRPQFPDTHLALECPIGENPGFQSFMIQAILAIVSEKM